VRQGFRPVSLATALAAPDQTRVAAALAFTIGSASSLAAFTSQMKHLVAVSMRKSGCMFAAFCPCA